MPISVIWDDDAQSIIRYIFVGQWQWSEFRPIIDQAVTMAKSVDHRVDTIADLRESGPLPRQNPFPTLKHMAVTTPPNSEQGTFQIIGGGSFVQSLGNAVKRVYKDGAPTYFVETLEEAYTFIAESRAADCAAQATDSAPGGGP